MYCRLIEQKGVREYLNAAQYVNENKSIIVRNAEFRLIGNIELTTIPQV